MVVIGPPLIGQRIRALPYTGTERPRYRLPRQTERLLELRPLPRDARASSPASVTGATVGVLALEASLLARCDERHAVARAQSERGGALLSAPSEAALAAIEMHSPQ
jgi:hypothetical protein